MYRFFRNCSWFNKHLLGKLGRFELLHFDTRLSWMIGAWHYSHFNTTSLFQSSRLSSFHAWDVSHTSLFYQVHSSRCLIRPLQHQKYPREVGILIYQNRESFELCSKRNVYQHDNFLKKDKSTHKNSEGQIIATRYLVTHCINFNRNTPLCDGIVSLPNLCAPQSIHPVASTLPRHW